MGQLSWKNRASKKIWNELELAPNEASASALLASSCTAFIRNSTTVTTTLPPCSLPTYSLSLLRSARARGIDD
jgi:hypothetical protein